MQKSLPIGTHPQFFLMLAWMIVCLVFSPARIACQVEDPTTGELLENYFRDTEQPDESDAQALLETLESLRQDPLDLNTATREDLDGMRLLNAIQVEQFLSYRQQFGPLLNVYELQAIPDWELADIRRVLPFVRIANGIDTRNQPLVTGFFHGENECLIRWGRQQPTTYPRSAEVKHNAWVLRYRHKYDNRMRFGFTAENDPGEPFFHASNSSGFDFYSAHFFVKNPGKTVRTFALGDFSARFGQGLLLQTGFSPGKSAETTSIARSGRKLNLYSGFGETFFLRGAAAAIGLGKNWEITILGASRRRDANVAFPSDTTDQDFADQIFTSLQSSGLHRTPAEIDDERAIREWVGGFSVTRSWKTGQISLNGLHVQYDKPWQPSAAPYRRFGFTGRQLTGGSVDYAWSRRNWYAFGEIARSDNGGMAGLNGLLFAADRRVTLALLHRAFARDYQSVYAAPFAETSGAANEQGLYLGTDVRLGRKWQFNTYADVWHHPWMRFGVGAPSSGSEYLGRILWTPKRGYSLYALWQIETKEHDGLSGLTDHQRNRLRVHASYRVSAALELRSRMEWSWYQIEDQGTSKGFLAYQEAVLHPPGAAFYGTVRYVIFDTQDYDSRVYAFEQDLFSALSIPAFAGRGSRYFFNLTWRVNAWLRLETRLEQTIQRLAVTDAGVTGRTTKWKLQARMQF